MKLVFLLLILIAYSFCSVIIIGRHIDKDEDIIGPNLAASPKGIVRSISLARKWHQILPTPDYLYFPTPYLTNGELIAVNNSLREIQTVAAVLQYYESKGLYPIVYTGYTVNDWEKLTYDLQKRVYSEKLDNSVHYICWSHIYINNITNGFVDIELPDWPETEYDRLYVIELDGNYTTSFNIIDGEYKTHVPTKISFDELYHMIK